MGKGLVGDGIEGFRLLLPKLSCHEQSTYK